MNCSCGAHTPAKDGLCGTCRLLGFVKKSTKYPWTPEMDEELVRNYRVAKSKSDLSARMTELTRRFEFPRYILQNRAQTLGLRIRVQRNWRPDELITLREYCGMLNLAQLARKVKRTESAVKNKLFTMGLGCDIVEGFSQNELAQLFGVHHGKVARWVERGWLFVNDQGRIPHATVEKFVWEHMDEYRFASCEEWWLKTMLNPKLGLLQMQRKAAA